MPEEKKIERIAEILRKLYGTPKVTINRGNNILDVLIATKLSQNTTDKSSYKAYLNLKKKFDSWDKVRKSGIKEIRECIKVCGLSNTKAREIKEMLNEMNKNYGSLDLSFLKKLSDEKVYSELLKYKGIGVKTISCMMNYSLGRDVFPIDTHIHRVLNRLGVVKTKSAEKTFEEAKDKIKKGKKHELHVNLIKFGRNICRSVQPLCGDCLLNKECNFENKSKQEKKFLKKETPQKNFIILENI